MPQLEEGDGTLADYAQRSGWQIDEQVALPVFTHVFTHFKLHITPLLLNLAGKPLKLQQSGSQWLDVDEALRAAIPAPVRRLLAGILSSKQ
jgi:A/G-specific adenine glycosylase